MEEANFILMSIKVTADKTTVVFTARGNDVKTTKELKVRPHPDLVAEIAKLNAMLNEVFKNDSMSATGLSVSGTGKEQKITITGKITFTSGRQVGLSSEPFTKDGYYTFEADLWTLKDNISSEVFAYLFQNKIADTQKEIPAGETDQGSGDGKESVSQDTKNQDIRNHAEETDGGIGDPAEAAEPGSDGGNQADSDTDEPI